MKEIKKIDTLGIAVINILVCSYMLPYLISLVFNVFHLTFLHLTLFGWLPGGAIAIYTIVRFYYQAKEGRYSLLKGMLAALLSAFMIIFTAVMIFTATMNFYHIYKTYNDVKENYSPVHFVADIDESYFYFEDQDGKFYRIDQEATYTNDDIQYKEQIEIIKQKINEDDDGSYFVVK